MIMINAKTLKTYKFLNVDFQEILLFKFMFPPPTHFFYSTQNAVPVC